MNINLENTRAEILKELDPNFGRDASSPIGEEFNRLQKQLDALEAGKSIIVTGSPAAPADLGSSRHRDHPVLKPYLLLDENLLWAGIPQPKFRYGLKQLPSTFLVMVLGSFAVCFFAAILSEVSAPKATAFPTDTLITFFWFAGIFAWLIYCWFGDSIFNRINLPKTVYGVTDKRVIVVITTRKVSVRSHLIRTATDLRLEIWRDGCGTIYFGADDSGAFGGKRFFSKSIFVLEHVPDAAHVFKLISDVSIK